MRVEKWQAWPPDFAALRRDEFYQRQECLGVPGKLRREIHKLTGH
jgi:hypothetical protein